MSATAATTATLRLEHHSDATGAKIGMWLFLYTELLLFAGMFLLYAVYRMKYTEEFHYAATQLNTLLGAINTIVLLTSSLTVALSIAALERGNKRLAVYLLLFTIACGLVFMVIKYFEWTSKFEHGLYPGSHELDSAKEGGIIFFNLYYGMTGLHGLHVLVGMGVLAVILVFILRNPYQKIKFHPHQLARVDNARLCIVGPHGERIWDGEPVGRGVREIAIRVAYDEDQTHRFNRSDLIKLENGGLYWHLVDIIWIFLFPLFYLIT